jgi:hypothetical protein
MIRKEAGTRYIIALLVISIGMSIAVFATDNIVNDGDSVSADTLAVPANERSCRAPVITNKPPNDILVADNSNALTYLFQADPGGVGGKGSVRWKLMWGIGDIDSVSGVYSFQSAQPCDCPIQIRAVNDCSPPKSDSCFFTVRARTDRSTSKKEPDGLPTMPVLRSRYVFGPEDAESVGVYIRVSGSTAPLEALGIKVGSPRLTNVYTATISVKQYTELLKLKPAIVVTLMTRGGGKSWSFQPRMAPKSPDLDTSTPYFFADSARALYGADSTTMSTEADRNGSVKKVRDGLPTHPVERAMYVFGPAEAESVTVSIETNGSTSELEAMGIKFSPSSLENVYDADLSVEEYLGVKALKSVIRATPMERGDIAWSAKECLPPVITNKPPNDTLVAINRIGLTYLFQADPGGVGGNGVVHWDSCLGLGSIDSVTGLYTLAGDNPPGYYQMLIRAVNDCSPPKADSCLFYVHAETEKAVAKKELDGLPTNPLLRSRYVFGPEDAESVAVLVETDGSTAELDAMGISLHARHRENTFTASLTVQQYIQVKKLKSVIHVTAMRIGGDVSW